MFEKFRTAFKKLKGTCNDMLLKCANVTVIFLCYTWPFWAVFGLITIWLHYLAWEAIVTGIVANLIYKALGYPKLD